MLAMDMGTGKSKVFTGLCDQWGAQRVVVLAPVRAMRVWPFEFAKHSERRWIVVNHGGHRRDGRLREKPTMIQRTAAAADALAQAERQGRPVCIVCNYEAAWQGELKKFFLAHEWDVLGLDESHKIKAPNGRWSRFAEALRRRCDRAVAMTGTPMPHSPPDLYGQFRALDPGVLGTNYHAYLNRYFRMGGFEQRQVIGFASPAAEAEHTERFARLAYICSADDVLDLPPESDLPPVTFRLGTDARRAYDQLDRDFVALIAENFRTCEECAGRGEDCPRCRGAGAVPVNPSVVSAANALAQLIRLAQVTSGYLPVEGEDGEVRHVRLGNEKQAALEELLESIGAHEKVVVFGRFHHDLDRIRETAEKLGRSYGEISGRRADGLRPGRDDPQDEPEHRRVRRAAAGRGRRDRPDRGALRDLLRDGLQPRRSPAVAQAGAPAGPDARDVLPLPGGREHRRRDRAPGADVPARRHQRRDSGDEGGGMTRMRHTEIVYPDPKEARCSRF